MTTKANEQSSTVANSKVSVPFLRGEIKTSIQAEAVIKKAANSFLAICGLITLSDISSVIGDHTPHRSGELMGMYIGYFIALLPIAIPAILLKTRRSSIAAKALVLISGLAFAFGLYLVIIGFVNSDMKWSMTGAVVSIFWACFLRIALRACYAIKKVREDMSVLQMQTQ